MRYYMKVIIMAFQQLFTTSLNHIGKAAGIGSKEGNFD